jgi:NADH-quinone oxidoreductase subunit J
MTFTQIVFIITGAVLIGAAVLTVTVQKMLHAALWLILTLFSVAVTFILLNNPFFGVVQVLVYIGAIAILIIFAIMLTRRMMYDDSTQFNMQWIAGLIVAVLLFGVLFLTMRMWPGFTVSMQGTPDTQAIQQLGMALVSPDSYLLPFEIASILLLASLVGAIYISREKNS